jgi:hypothetical protein
MNATVTKSPGYQTPDSTARSLPPTSRRSFTGGGEYRKAWIARFERNRLNRPEPDWAAPLEMPEEKRRALAWSLAEYQLGDGGGPCQLIAGDAEQLRNSAADVRRVMELWFKEEAEHSRLLSGAVRRLNGEFVETTFAFRMFCRVRRILGAQFEMLVLLLVEIVSTGYYRVIQRHAGDAPIEAMCRLILRDEAGHIAFHRDRLAESYPRGVAWWWKTGFRLLGYACAAFLWLGHGRSFRAMGARPAELFRHVRSGMHVFLRKLAGSVRETDVSRPRLSPMQALAVP